MRYELYREEMHYIPEETDAFLENGTILRTRLPIDTKQDLEDFVGKLLKNKKRR
jgi:hypothetical protein